MRRKFGAIVAACTIAIAVSACGPPVPSTSSCSPTSQAASVAATIFSRIQQDRGSLGTLTWNPQLACLALDLSQHNGNAGTSQHRDLNAVLHSPGYEGYHTLGENIFAGPASMTGNQIEDAFMNSQVHRDTILSTSFRSVGVGVYYAPNGYVYVTQDFGG